MKFSILLVFALLYSPTSSAAEVSAFCKVTSKDFSGFFDIMKEGYSYELTVKKEDNQTVLRLKHFFYLINNGPLYCHGPLVAYRNEPLGGQGIKNKFEFNEFNPLININTLRGKVNLTHLYGDYRRLFVASVDKFGNSINEGFDCRDKASVELELGEGFTKDHGCTFDKEN